MAGLAHEDNKKIAQHFIQNTSMYVDDTGTYERIILK
jgi:hypothetical protein